MKKGRIIKYLLWSAGILFLLLNLIAAIQAHKFTHFTPGKIRKTPKPEFLSFSRKIKTLVMGVDNPRPVDTNKPVGMFEDVQIQSNKRIDCWLINAPENKGCIILFHGYGSEKSSLLKNAAYFNQLGYNTLLVDFMGSGTSEGNQTTIGFKEAEEVKSCYDYLAQHGNKNIILYGASMGAVAILKAVHDYPISPKAIIIECPFGSIYRTVCNRFHNMGVPVFPAAGLLTFWGGIENGFWPFSYTPSDYAKSVKCPALLMYGAKDKNVARDEIDEIYDNLAGEKELKIFPQAGHENYLGKFPEDWKNNIKDFITDLP